MYVLNLLNAQWKGKEVKVTYKSTTWIGRCVEFATLGNGKQCLVLDREQGGRSEFPIDFETIEINYPMMDRKDALKKLSQLKREKKFDGVAYSDKRAKAGDKSVRCKVIIFNSVDGEVEQFLASQGFELHESQPKSFFANSYFVKIYQS